MRLEIGHVDRPHGLRGDVIVGLTTTELDRLAAGRELFVGDRVLTIVRSSPHKHRFIVHFDGIETREEAESIAGALLSADRPEGDDGADDDSLWIHELIGAEVLGPGDERYGTVVSVEANPASDLLVLEDDSLVPLTFVIGWIERPRSLRIDPPAGLIEPHGP